WPVGAPVQGPLHVLSELAREHGIVARDVKRVVVRIPEGEFNVVNRSEMSDISLQYLLAVMLIDGTVTFKAAHDHRRMRDPRARAGSAHRIDRRSGPDGSAAPLAQHHGGDPQGRADAVAPDARGQGYFRESADARGGGRESAGPDGADTGEDAQPGADRRAPW